MQSIILVITSLRNEHGVRHNDYERYRHVCSKRLQRLRKNALSLSSKLDNLTISNEAETNFSQILIPLIQTERNWAYALEIKQLSKFDQRKTQHLKQKLKRAKFTAERLLEMVDGNNGSIPEYLKDEVRAYADLMAGNFFFEKQEWKSSLDLYTNSR
jgi:signal recognition particle subunit SRP68